MRCAVGILDATQSSFIAGVCEYIEEEQTVKVVPFKEDEKLPEKIKNQISMNTATSIVVYIPVDRIVQVADLMDDTEYDLNEKV